jgi:AbrB family looped-hinge helix DNA binding protein
LPYRFFAGAYPKDRIFCICRNIIIGRIVSVPPARCLTERVLVTRRGQTTIPARIRKKLDIREGTSLEVEIVGDKVVFSKAPSMRDLDGKSKLTKEQAFRLLDKMRLEEEAE